MRSLIVVSSMLLAMASAVAQVSIGISVPGVSIGINVPVYPQLVRVPGYPVYYAPGMRSNFFFYDGMYWVYQGDNWYASSWYNGPWGLVRPEFVPVFVLRVPVRYYGNPPDYFRGWQREAPPRWGEHWGREWEQHRRGWDHWDRRAVPAPAPLPMYQRKYSGTRYPPVERQPELQDRNYRYQPRDEFVQQHYREQAGRAAPAPSPRAQQPARPSRQAAPQPETRGPQGTSREPAQGNAPAHGQGRGKGRDKEGERGDEPGQGNRR